MENLFSGTLGNVDGLRTWVHQCLLYGRPLALAPGLGWAWVLALLFLALYVGIALLFREGLFRCVETFESQPGQTVLAALIAMLLTPVLVVLLCVTVIGIAAVPFVVAGLLCVSLFGKAVILAWVGRRVTSRHAAGPMSHPRLRGADRRHSRIGAVPRPRAGLSGLQSSGHAGVRRRGVYPHPGREGSPNREDRRRHLNHSRLDNSAELRGRAKLGCRGEYSGIHVGGSGKLTAHNLCRFRARSQCR